MASTTTTAPVRPRFQIRLPEAVSVLRERDFRVIWIGSAVSLVGTWMQVIAQGLVVLSLWNSAFALGAVNFANATPTLCVMLFGGVLADRSDKRRILIVTQAVMAALAAIVGVLVLTDMVQFWMLIVVTAVLGVAIGYDMPAYSAFLPELVPPEEISQVVALNSSTFHGSRMVGPAIAGAVISVLGFSAAYFLNAASFLAVILSLMIIRSRPRPREVSEHRVSAIEGLKEGIRHARGRRNIQVLLMITALNTTLIFPSMAVLMPLYAKDVLHAGPGTLGLLFAASGLGSMLGALALIWWSRNARVTRIWLGAVTAPAALLVMAISREPAISIAASGVLSLAFSSQLGLVMTMIQESTPGEFRGRVMSLHGITFTGTMPIAGIIAAGAAVALGLPFVMVASAAVYLVGAALLLRFAGGGIERVVEQSGLEYEAVAAGAGV